MKRYNVYVLPEARADLKEIADYIADTLQAPATAKKYAKGLVKALMGLCTYAEAIPAASYKSVRRYGMSARSITYKNHTIVYTVQDDAVVIRRIVAAALIKG